MRTGKKNQPFFKIIVTEKENPPRGGRFVEEVGFYNPLTKEKSIRAERVTYWISKGAQPSDTVHNMLVKNGILKEKKIAVHKKAKESASSADKPEKVAEVKPVPAAEPPAEAKPVVAPEAKPEAAPEGGEPRPAEAGREPKPDIATPNPPKAEQAGENKPV